MSTQLHFYCQAALTGLRYAEDLLLAPFNHDAIVSSSRLVVADPSAIASLAQAFEGHIDLAWVDQVAVFASDPGARQLAAFSGAALHVTKPTILLAAGETATATRQGRTALVSDNASTEDAAHARALVGG